MRHGTPNASKRPRTTFPDPTANRPTDLVHRDFAASAPNRLWVADFTYVPTWTGMVYVAFVVDAFSRRVIGWRVATSMTTSLVLDALEHAIFTRAREGVTELTGLISHSDAGSQGGFHRSSQHLDGGGVGWGRCGSGSGRFSCIEGSCPRRGGRRGRGVRTGCGSGPRSRVG